MNPCEDLIFHQEYMVHFTFLLYDKCRFTPRLGNTYSGVISSNRTTTEKTKDDMSKFTYV